MEQGQPVKQIALQGPITVYEPFCTSHLVDVLVVNLIYGTLISNVTAKDFKWSKVVGKISVSAIRPL